MIEKRDIEKGIIDMFRVNMKVKSGEKLLIVTDPPTEEKWKTFDLNRTVQTISDCSLDSKD